MMSGASGSTISIMIRYGELIGAAFQLSDDLLDITSDISEFGKTPGTDLREGVATLPVLYAQRSVDPNDARLLELLAADLSDDALHGEALALLRAHPAVAAARAELDRWAEEARDALASLPDLSARRALESLCDFVVSRTR
jgi:heptaprenyl diphosphate synthase